MTPSCSRADAYPRRRRARVLAVQMSHANASKVQPGLEDARCNEHPQPLALSCPDRLSEAMKPESGSLPESALCLFAPASIVVGARPASLTVLPERLVRSQRASIDVHRRRRHVARRGRAELAELVGVVSIQWIAPMSARRPCASLSLGSPALTIGCPPSVCSGARNTARICRKLERSFPERGLVEHAVLHHAFEPS